MTLYLLLQPVGLNIYAPKLDSFQVLQEVLLITNRILNLASIFYTKKPLIIQPEMLGQLNQIPHPEITSSSGKIKDIGIGVA